MKRSRWLTLVVLSCLMAGIVRAAEEGYLVKVVGLDRKAEWSALSETDFKNLEKTIKLEQKYFSKAVELAGKEWRADELNKGVNFPGSRLTPRMIMQKDKHPSLEKASAWLTKIQDQESKKTDKSGGKKGSSKKGKLSPQETRDAELSQAISLVKTKLDDLVSKGGSTVNAAGPEAKADAKDGKAVNKADAKEAVKKAL